YSAGHRESLDRGDRRGARVECPRREVQTVAGPPPIARTPRPSLPAEEGDYSVVTCTDFLSKMTDYFDGQIAPDLLQEVRAHLCECSHCEGVVNTTRQTI